MVVIVPSHIDEQYPEVLIIETETGKVSDSVNTRLIFDSLPCFRIKRCIYRVNILDYLTKTKRLALASRNRLAIYDFRNNKVVHQKEGTYDYADEGKFMSRSEGFIYYGHPSFFMHEKTGAIYEHRQSAMGVHPPHELEAYRRIKNPTLLQVFENENRAAQKNNSEMARLISPVSHERLYFSALLDEATLVVVSDTGLHIFNPNTNMLLATLFLVGEGGYVIYTPDSYVDATDDARDALLWKIEDRLYPYDVFWLKYHVPDLLSKVLSGNIAYRLGNLRNLAKKGRNDIAESESAF